MFKRIVVSVALIALACVFAACERRSRPGPNVWAMVNGQPILRQQVERYYRSQFTQPGHPSPEEAKLLKLNILDELINNQLLLQQSQKLGLGATEGEVEKKFSELKAPFSDQEFQQQLEQRGITVDELKNDLRERISIQKLMNREIKSKITVSKKEIAAAYKRNKSAYNVAEPEYHVAQIVVTPHADSRVRNRKDSDAKTPAQALRKIRMLLKQLRSGASFSQLAMNYSEDPMTASTGGDLGFIAESALNQGQPALKRAVLALKPGQISGIIHVKGSYRIIKLIAKISPGERKLSEPDVQQSIREALRDRKEQLLRAAYLAKLRDRAHVTNYLARQILASAGNLPAEEPAKTGGSAAKTSSSSTTLPDKPAAKSAPAAIKALPSRG